MIPRISSHTARAESIPYAYMLLKRSCPDTEPEAFFPKLKEHELTHFVK